MNVQQTNPHKQNSCFPPNVIRQALNGNTQKKENDMAERDFVPFKENVNINKCNLLNGM